ncbi:esterase B1 [Culex quinquefasciatus]|uniref:Carboxylic ester hydrolase n=1 Tax=Culex quinquefasciatus TaxID=7176 RepID=B0XAM9_CULQU|nr:esterase B1 [Culex quinquefasciatus]|eukprot:XP_001866701.1 esterase B1 [Culex quinquefasciatus]
MVIRKLYTPPVVTRNGHGATTPPIAAVPTKELIVPEPVAVPFSAAPVEQPVVVEATPKKDDVIVTIKAGKLEGEKVSLPNGEQSYRFSGIPYAKPPVGKLRFKPPVPLESFGVDLLDCKKERSNAFGVMYFEPGAAENASEDCLFLNVQTPCIETGKGLPVMVWIHGGGFNMGSGNSVAYCPEYLVQEGVVVVTFNYRLGPLGFMYFPAAGIHGNMGLKDQRCVLRWVQENIRNFGGDPSNVTLFGESAGGASVHLNYLADSSRQYFHKAICMSGVSYNPWVLQADGEGKARRLAALFGAESSDDQDVLRKLMEASAVDLFAKCQLVITDKEKLADMFFAFTPVVELETAEEPFLTQNFITLIMNPNLTSIPMMNGITSSEGLLIAGTVESSIAEYRVNPTKLVPLEMLQFEDRVTEVADEIKAFFFGSDDISEERLQSLVDIVSDNMFVMAAYVAAELHARYQPKTPQFFYVASFEGELNKFRKLFSAPDHLSGVCHADETLYLFSSRMMDTNVEPGSRADRFRSTMCRMWTNFAKFGNPTPADGGVDFDWKPVPPVEDGGFTLVAADLNEESKMVENPFLERIQFWRELFGRHYGNYLVRDA